MLIVLMSKEKNAHSQVINIGFVRAVLLSWSALKSAIVAQTRRGPQYWPIPIWFFKVNQFDNAVNSVNAERSVWPNKFANKLE